MIKLFEDRKECTGCGACRFVCPKDAVRMEADEEGFAVPVVDGDKCIDCGACLRICPVRNAEAVREKEEPRFFVARHQDPEVLFHSTSGGAFTALSDAVLARGGVVYGVDFGEDLEVCHVRTDDRAGRDRMRYSKYVQSRLDDEIYRQIGEDLKAGRDVLFTGTPCQTAAMRSVFGKQAHLYLVDLICHGVPSPLLWKAYRETLEQENGAPVVWASFRTKENGWFRGQYQIYYKVKGREERLEDTRFFEMFFRSRYVLRESCHACPWSSTRRAADLTIADYWGIEKFSEAWCDRRGVSLIMVHTPAGRELLHRSRNLLTEERDREEALSQQMRLSSPAVRPDDREEFWKLFYAKGFGRAAEEMIFRGMQREIRAHLTDKILPFWRSLRDDENGGYCGLVSADLGRDFSAVRGGVLNARILWFFSEAARVLEGAEAGDSRKMDAGKGSSLLSEADHAYEFLTGKLLDRERGGLFWSVKPDGTPEDTTKHTYAQAFAIYGLSAYYRVSGKKEAKEEALSLFHLIESRMRDEKGYLEAFTGDFRPAENDKLSENGVMADRTMNTALHLLEAYTELLDITGDAEVESALRGLVEILSGKMYNPEKHRLEVFFDREYRTLIDLHSYGHDIEAAWLMRRAAEILAKKPCEKAKDGSRTGEDQIPAIADDLTEEIFRHALRGHSIPMEAENGTIRENRIWWVQAEGVNGFLDAWKRNPEKGEYLMAAKYLWDYIKAYIADSRPGGEWLSEDPAFGGDPDAPAADIWKCPYHNGRMCLRILEM